MLCLKYHTIILQQKISHRQNFQAQGGTGGEPGLPVPGRQTGVDIHQAGGMEHVHDAL